MEFFWVIHISESKIEQDSVFSTKIRAKQYLKVYCVEPTHLTAQYG